MNLPASTGEMALDVPPSSLPRLAYIGDVPVESSYHGSALLYRLLENYSRDKIRIVETSLAESQPYRRLPGVCYSKLSYGHRRLLHTRFASGYRAWLTWAAAARHRKLLGLLRGFQPEAVLTVAHGFSWRTASQFATQHQLPLHFICHDDLPRWGTLPAALEGWLDREFGRTYRQAVSRLCISPFMRDTYQERYGVSGDVIYPSRASGCPDYATPPERLREARPILTGAYAGSIGTDGFARTLCHLAHSLAALGGRLMLFGPLGSGEIKSRRLDLPNVVSCGLVTSQNMIERCRAEADFLFVPMSFDACDRANAELSFPSKLTDYTAAGLPLLVCGPAYCSAVRWARENPGVAEILETEEPTAFQAALQRMGESASHRIKLAERALELGREFFSHAAAERLFHKALQRRTNDVC